MVRMTKPGVHEIIEPEVISEWRGVGYVESEPIFEQKGSQFWGPYTLYPAPELTGIVMHLDLSNTSVMRLDYRATLNDRVGLELWAPLTAEGDAAPLDPLQPRRDWDTSTGSWVRARYYWCNVVQYLHESFVKEMAVNVGRGPNTGKLYQVEVLNR